MWGSLLVLALLITLHPVRLGVILLVICRPRPMQNLFAYWAGCAIAGVYSLLIPLVVLHVTPVFDSFLMNFANPTANSTVRHIEIGVGALTLVIAAILGVRFATRPPGHPRRHQAASGGSTSTLVLDSNTPTAISRLLGTPPDAATEGGSVFRRLLRRIRSAWENGSVWVALVIGVAMGPSLDGVVFVLAIIVASGASFGVQITAAITFVIAMLAVEEVILVSHLVRPAKTQAFLRRLHDWALAHRRKLLVAILAVVGVSLMAQGMGAA
ncbi:MAG: hypothetical protein QOJ80_4090 [Mycobacterium sp.]|jgi:hypothetical protein|nr:hypothetical protein [Mycobacterium sp.]